MVLGNDKRLIGKSTSINFGSFVCTSFCRTLISALDLKVFVTSLDLVDILPPFQLTSQLFQ